MVRTWSSTGASRHFAGDGFFIGVSLVDGVRPGMKVYDDEIFGPVLAVVRVDTYDEALRMVNDNPYGNGCTIFTHDGGAARQFEFDVVCGMVGVNIPIPVPVSYYSFGGWKSSLFGDAAIYGPAGSTSTRTKVVTSRWPNRRPPPSTSASPAPAEIEIRTRWISVSCCRPIHQRGTSSSSRSRPSCWGSRMRGRSTRTCCGRNPSSSTARCCRRRTGSSSARW